MRARPMRQPIRGPEQGCGAKSRSQLPHLTRRWDAKLHSNRTFVRPRPNTANGSLERAVRRILPPAWDRKWSARRIQAWPARPRNGNTRLVENMRWQMDAVLGALSAQPGTLPPVTPVLCFVDGDWPLLWPPSEFKGVRLEGIRSIKKLLGSAPTLDAGAIDRIHRVLATA